MRINNMGLLGSSVPSVDRLLNPQPTFMDRIGSFGDFLKDTLSTSAPVVKSYFEAETARATARASSNLLPRSMADKSTLESPYTGPVMVGVGVLGVVLLAGALSKKRRR